jgi:hypothetical protein
MEERPTGIVRSRIINLLSGDACKTKMEVLDDAAKLKDFEGRPQPAID